MTTNNVIRLKQLVADPEAYIKEMIQLHPGSNHNKEAGSFIIQNDIINSALRYRWLEEGLFLFCFESFSPIDAHFEFVENPSAEYFSIIFYFTESSSHTPFYVKTTEGIYSDDQCALFFNGNLNAEIFLKAHHKAFGLRVDLHHNWLKKNIQIDTLPKDSVFLNIFTKNQTSYTHTNCRSYISPIQSICDQVKEGKSPFTNLLIKKEVFQLIIDYIQDLNKISISISEKNDTSTLSDLSLQNALKYMKNNIYEKFPGSDFLAEKCGLSESNFSKKFKHTFHVNASTYYKELQMKEAVQLLNLGKRVKFVAHKLGYQNVASFGRAFKLHFGKSPASSVE
ncbi:helix-turn-helix domain-containing protein [Rhizosphaericola mali]|uniref:Helix-turn-helix transcriptional regulator n=1 Tax=Rhizosphaericola mali TaxID=2545455 RepID=A0A5P2G215_9BACT|nr:AraC family transcriptional regulator [Rhizosphaericola mali]QES89217.1 helix-turn-helix transcriptional regulator [Rhizosphaericola mali]